MQTISNEITVKQFRSEFDFSKNKAVVRLKFVSRPMLLNSLVHLFTEKGKDLGEFKVISFREEESGLSSLTLLALSEEPCYRREFTKYSYFRSINKDKRDITLTLVFTLRDYKEVVRDNLKERGLLSEEEN